MCGARLCVVVLAAAAGQAGAARGHELRRQAPHVTTVAAGLDAESPQHGRARKLSEALSLGLDAIKSTIRVFTADPLDIDLGIETIRAKYWELVLRVVPERHHQSEVMAIAKVAFDQAFVSAPAIAQDIIDFRASGETGKLVSGLRTLTSNALSGCVKTFPEEAMYFKALGDLLDGLGESWEEFSNGSTAAAVRLVWDAVHASADDVLAERDKETYMYIVVAIDRAIGSLSRHVLEYKRIVLNSKVCYKRSLRRERARPSVCREGFEWDQGTLCVPQGSGNGADCYSHCGKRGGLCETFCGALGACCKQGHSRDPAECEGARGFVDTAFSHGTSWKYHQCVRAGPSVAFTVHSSGTPAVNGAYVRSGAHSGRPRYTKIRAKYTIMEYSKKRGAWRLFIDDTVLGYNRPTLYVSRENATAFPTSGWGLEDGGSPAPVVSPYTPEGGVGASLLEAGGRSRGVARGPKRNGAQDALCNVSSEYNERDGDWCLKQCPGGFHASGAHCVQACGGDFPAEGYGNFVCGTAKSELVQAVAEMVAMVANGAIEAYALVSEMRGTGVHAEVLLDTIDAFVEMGKPFARPQCPEAS